MSAGEANNFDGGAEARVIDGGVLAALPRTRPQRTSPRRAAARAGTAAKARKPTAKPAVEKRVATKKRVPKPIAETATPSAKSPPTQPASKPTAKPAEPPAPKQGYEPEEEFELGNTVNPPSGVELVESVADIVGELANSGLAAGKRILEDAFSLLRRS